MTNSTVAKAVVLALVSTGSIMAASRQLVAGESQENTDRHRAVLAMQPVGYWPAGEGEGDVLHDRSGNDNHGRIYHAPWRNGLLDFTSGFQWAEIPSHAACATGIMTGEGERGEPIGLEAGASEVESP